MISKNLTKYVRSLEQKKTRQNERRFIAEGPKVVDDLMANSQPAIVVATAEWLNTHTLPAGTETYEADEEELRRLSFLQHPQQVLAVFPLPDLRHTVPILSPEQLVLALDNVQDPGNLGTIIRIADWFGIETIICNNGTADAYNPKVVQATMGSIARVSLSYTDLPTLLSSLPVDIPVYGTLLDGADIYQQQLSTGGIIIMGNEGNGISPEVRPFVRRPLFIPNYPIGRTTVESLNVAIATAITCAEFRRRL